MLKSFVVAIALVTAPLASQTTPHKSAPPPQNKSGQSSTSAALDDKLSALEARVAKLEGTVSFYKFLIDTKQDKQDTALLDPSSRGFLRLDSDNATFLVSLQDASPYLTGYRIKLNIGNPSDATFSNAKLKVRWSRPLKSYSEYESWQKSIHEKETDLTDDLIPGNWNTVTVDLLPCAPDELGYLEVSLQTPTVSLHTR